jgi:hypothetical protein
MRWVCLALLLCACTPGASCSLAGGDVDESRDPIVKLADYNGPDFSELGDVEVDGDTVWFCSGVIGINAYDASNPNALKKLDSLAVSIGSTEYPRCQHLALAPDADVYVSNRGDSIQPESFIARIDGSNPSDLIERDVWTTDDDVEGLTVHGDNLLIAAHDDGLVIRDRFTFEEVGRLRDLGNVWQVRAVGDRAYAATGEQGLAIVDIRDPSQPQLISTASPGGQSKDVVVVGDRAWLAAGTAGVAAIDLADETAPTVLHTEDTPGSALALTVLQGTDTIAVADWNDVRLFDISDPGSLVALGHQPLLVRSDLDSRTLGIASNGDDVVYSGNWTALAAYQVFPGRASGDLDLFPGQVAMPRTDPGDTSNVLVDVRNAGPGPLVIEGVQSKGRGLEVELEPVTLKAGQSTVARVRWTAPNPSPLDGLFHVLSNDADEPRKCVPVSGNSDAMGVGDAIFGVSFLGLDGQTWSLESLRGTPVLLAYFATF